MPPPLPLPLLQEELALGFDGPAALGGGSSGQLLGGELGMGAQQMGDPHHDPHHDQALEQLRGLGIS